MGIRKMNNRTEEQYRVCSFLFSKKENSTMVYKGHHKTMDDATMAARKNNGDWTPVEYTIESNHGGVESWRLLHGQWIMGNDR
jgi:hypothetical protein